ncbi:hypothetical protein EDC32_102248 [Laceyella sacchari]|jgi:hypothetical protein|uniref:helix-turn-helix domain-containing protein n=1 Tax=Laceyella sacchari TaxID=37482 RepID=UPI001045DDFC|nr:helix-turn-helix transcriptional regulator [Laceyella sacchari]TCW39008.1 hypothetical protein EDC32_102248 [Laceyella sacchari]
MVTVKLTKKDIDTLIGILGVSKQEFAEKAGYSRAHFYKYYGAPRGVPYRMSTRICETYNLTDEIILQLRAMQSLVYDAVTEGDGE